MRTARSPRRGPGAALLAVLVLALAMLGAPAPAQASTGGSAQATGIRAIAPEVTLEVSTSGAVARVQPILDRLTARPILTGRELIAAEVGTPQAPAGQEADHSPQHDIPHLLTIEEVRAQTERVQDEELSATASTGAVQIGVLGLEVLSVGPVQASATTHPSQDPTAAAQVPTLSVFSQQVELPEGEPVQIDEAISTSDALDALEEAFPGLRAITQAVGATVSASGELDVLLGTTQDAEPSSGAARAVALTAQVTLDLQVDICIPQWAGSGCAAEVEISTNAQVLDLVLAETSVERPETLPITERIPWAVLIPLGVLGGVGLLLGAILLGRRFTERPAGEHPEAEPQAPPQRPVDPPAPDR